MRLLRTNGENIDFNILVKELDSDLLERNKDIQKKYNSFNVLPNNVCVVVCYGIDDIIGCGCLKILENESTVEVKRMFIRSIHRGFGYSKKILAELEKWAIEMEKNRMILETGKKQSEAISLYLSYGFKVIENYGKYKNIENSICMEKIIRI
jgi:putative acetyltransferase